MNEKFLQDAFGAAKPYRGKPLKDWFSQYLGASPQALAAMNAGFFTTMATWVVRKFKERGVPVGHLEKFVFKGGQKFNFFNALMAQVASHLRKKGLQEADELEGNVFLQKLETAFKRART